MNGANKNVIYILDEMNFSPNYQYEVDEYAFVFLFVCYGNP